jgi:NTP pyrophosphatase (non-canonical NTP hydrolase)
MSWRAAAVGASCGAAGFAAGAAFFSCTGAPRSDLRSTRAGVRPILSTRGEFGVAHCDARTAAVWAPHVSLESLRSMQAAFARARDWEQHHIPRSIALALVGEAGELCECFQWKKDAQCENGLQGWSEEERTHLGEELSDVLLYLIRCAGAWCTRDAQRPMSTKPCSSTVSAAAGSPTSAESISPLPSRARLCPRPLAQCPVPPLAQVQAESAPHACRSPRMRASTRQTASRAQARSTQPTHSAMHRSLAAPWCRHVSADGCAAQQGCGAA